MAAPPSLTTIANVMKIEKELFWIQNKHLSASERQRQWTAHTADLASAIGATAPTEPLDLQKDATDQKTRDQHAAMPCVTQMVLTHYFFYQTSTAAAPG